MDGKIFKISGYLVDPNGENEAAWIRNLQDNTTWSINARTELSGVDLMECLSVR